MLRGRNLGITRGEKLLLLQFDAFPGRVAEDDIESASALWVFGATSPAGGKNLGKLQRPMEEQLADGECHVPAMASQRLGFAGVAQSEKVLSATLFLAVPLCSLAGGGLVVAFARVESL